MDLTRFRGAPEAFVGGIHDGRNTPRILAEVPAADDLAAVAATLNSRPRKTLDWRTPAEALDEVLLMRCCDRRRRMLR